jgi:hypothetical protein
MQTLYQFYLELYPAIRYIHARAWDTAAIRARVQDNFEFIIYL